LALLESRVEMAIDRHRSMVGKRIGDGAAFDVECASEKYKRMDRCGIYIRSDFH
jgi:hypothetical protein